jgi:hypothetical protein
MRRKDFAGCIEERKLFETGVEDKSMAKELLVLAEHKELFWKSVSDKAKEFPSLFIEGYYEIIKELCTAILTLDGWKALDHECLFAYLKKNKSSLEIDFDYLLELKDTRNAIDYRGVMVSHDIWKNNELKINLVVNGLKEYIKSKLES